MSKKVVFYQNEQKLKQQKANEEAQVEMRPVWEINGCITQHYILNFSARINIYNIKSMGVDLY